MSSFGKHFSGYNLRSYRVHKESSGISVSEHTKDRPTCSSPISEHAKRRSKINFSPRSSNDLNDSSAFRSNNDLRSENILLREELVAVHKSYSQERKRMIASQDRAIQRQTDREDRVSEIHRSEIISYREAEYHLNADIADYITTVDDLAGDLQAMDRELRDTEDELRNTASTLTDHLVLEEEWIGRTLKFQYLFQQIDKIGLKQSEDIFDAFQDIEVPDVSINIKDKFVPTSQTDNIDWQDNIEDIDLQEDIEWQDNIEWQGDIDWHESDIIGEEQNVRSTDLNQPEEDIILNSETMEDMSGTLNSLFSEE